MTKSIKIAKTLLVTYYAYMLEYRAELFLWALSGALPFILMGVWMQAAETGQFGLNSIDFARYFLAAFIVRQTNVVWVIWEFEKEVVQGRLSNRLLQPLDPVWHHFASHVSERFARLPFVCGLALLFFALYPQSFWLPSLGRFLLFLLVVVLAFCLRFLIQYTFALFAFWLERASAIEQFWFLIYLFLSGTYRAARSVSRTRARSSFVDAFSLFDSFSCFNLDRIARRCRPRFVGNVGLECGVFCVESLALAAGLEAVFGHGRLNNN